MAWGQPADAVRIATFAAPLSRDGPGLLLRDILRGGDPQIQSIVDVIDHVGPDILLLTDFDFDAGGVAMAAFSDVLAHPYPYQFSLAPNAGLSTGLDIDGDGFTGDARDAMGYGRFFGDGGMALFSRYPIHVDRTVDLTGLLWRDVPKSVMPTMDGAPFPSAQVHDVIRVSSSGHWIVPIEVGTTVVTLLAFSATAPVFDGPEDFNGLRNRDELRVWEAVLDGALGPTPAAPVLLGNVNAEPNDGQGLREGIAAVLARPDLRDPLPKSGGGRADADANHHGDPSLDTADWGRDDIGNLRVSYVLPSADLTIIDAGVFWPAPNEPDAALLGVDGADAGPHRLVWADVAIEDVREKR